MKTIAIISDTHDLLLDSAKSIIHGCDVVIHAGDFSSEKILEALRFGPSIYAVRGNCDGAWASMLRQTLDFTIEGVRFALAHQGEHLPRNPQDFDVMICGHTHVYREARDQQVLYLNPGSAGRSRAGLPNTMARMQVDHGSYTVEKIILAGE